jgi:hypothetical protein
MFNSSSSYHPNLIDHIHSGFNSVSHDIDPFADAIVSYGLDEMGKPVKIYSTGILYGHEIKTFTERVTPGEAVTTKHVFTDHLTPYDAIENQTTRTDITHAGRYVKETTYSPSRVRPVYHDFV